MDLGSNAEIRVRRVGGLFTPRRDELLVRGQVRTTLAGPGPLGEQQRYAIYCLLDDRLRSMT